MDRQWGRIDATLVSLAASSIERRIAVQHLSPMAIQRRPDAIVVPWHRRKVADKQHLVPGTLPVSEKANHAALRIAAVYPLKPGRIKIQFEERRLAAVKSIQIADPAPQQPNVVEDTCNRCQSMLES